MVDKKYKIYVGCDNCHEKSKVEIPNGYNFHSWDEYGERVSYYWSPTDVTVVTLFFTRPTKHIIVCPNCGCPTLEGIDADGKTVRRRGYVYD